ncbi:MAG: nitroreductase family deazaflavin-dependent oxidoreductase [Deltaproteobacteria bacterium]|nr:nitroreductase family deazaflavin-dependent oxidoreductase [Deltaproteobacteria bacterium]MBW2445499.1 nitroreductase family deazaflavin-dependent oxidoreductase [Deltaproteobacteria bacterium]
MSERVIPKPDFLEQEEWNNLIATRDPAVIRMASQFHVKRYLELDGGEDTFLTQGAPTLLLGTSGRKSGNEVISPANFFQDGDDLLVVGSIAGLDRHPHWALNLEANPEAWVQVKAKRWPVRAHKLEGEARAARWPELTEFFPLWGHFQKYCDREFFVFVLSPAEK